MEDIRNDVRNTQEKIRKSQAWRRLEQAWNENPLAVIAVGSAALVAVSKIIDAVSSSRSRRAFAKQVDYRVNRRASQKRTSE